MTLYTIGFTQKSAECFFGTLKEHHIEMLVDIRLNNRSQLAGFTKGDDLKYFLQQICGCRYAHCQQYAPTKDILESYKKKQTTWDAYVNAYLPLMCERRAVDDFLERFSLYHTVCLLCSEPTPNQCHRRLLAELIAERDPEIPIQHL